MWRLLWWHCPSVLMLLDLKASHCWNWCSIASWCWQNLKEDSVRRYCALAISGKQWPPVVAPPKPCLQNDPDDAVMWLMNGLGFNWDITGYGQYRDNNGGCNHLEPVIDLDEILYISIWIVCDIYASVSLQIFGALIKSNLCYLYFQTSVVKLSCRKTRIKDVIMIKKYR